MHRGVQGLEELSSDIGYGPYVVSDQARTGSYEGNALVRRASPDVLLGGAGELVADQLLLLGRVLLLELRTVRRRRWPAITGSCR